LAICGDQATNPAFNIAGLFLAVNPEFNHRGGVLVHALPYGDNVGQVVLFGTLAFIINLTLQRRSFRLRGNDHCLVHRANHLPQVVTGLIYWPCCARAPKPDKGDAGRERSGGLSALVETTALWARRFTS